MGEILLKISARADLSKGSINVKQQRSLSRAFNFLAGLSKNFCNDLPICNSDMAAAAEAESAAR